MSRPRVTFPNQRAVYEYYDNRPINPRMARMAHFISSHIYNVEDRFADGAEDKIRQHFSEGKKILIPINHTLADDPFVMAAEATRRPPLNPLVANTIIPAKSPLYKSPGVRHWLDEVGARPTLRGKDLAKLKGGRWSDEELEEMG